MLSRGCTQESECSINSSGADCILKITAMVYHLAFLHCDLVTPTSLCLSLVIDYHLKMLNRMLIEWWSCHRDANIKINIELSTPGWQCLYFPQRKFRLRSGILLASLTLLLLIHIPSVTSFPKDNNYCESSWHKWACLFLTFKSNWIMWYVIFHFWPPLLNILFIRLICVPCNSSFIPITI